MYLTFRTAVKNVYMCLKVDHSSGNAGPIQLYSGIDPRLRKKGGLRKSSLVKILK